MNRKSLMAAIVAIVAAVAGVGIWRGAHGRADVTSGGDATRALTVEIVAPELRTWPGTEQASGPVTAWQEVIVSPETGGLRIADLQVDVGARVKRGQLLASLADDSLRTDLHKQEALLAQANASLEQAVSNLRRAQMVGDSGGLSPQQLEEYRINEATARASMRSAKADVDSVQLKLRQSRVVAPDDGIVSSKSAVLGNVVSAGAEMFRLIRQGRLEWRPEVDARQLNAIHVGQLADVMLPSGQHVQGRIREIGPALSTDTGRATVYVSLPADSAARQGMFANGAIEYESRAATTLPQSAVVPRDGRSYVYMVDANGRVSSRAVDTGRRSGDRIEILTAMDKGARVVARGGAFLSEDAIVDVVPATQDKARSAP